MKMNDAKANILIVYAGKTTTAEIVVRFMYKYAEVRGVEVTSKEALSINADDINHSDTVIAIRGADYFISNVVSRAKRAGKQCILYLDDDLLSLYDYNNECSKGLRKCLDSVDILWVSNANILEKYSRYVSMNAKCVDAVVLDPWDNLSPYTPDDGKVKIVFAGSPSHEPLVIKFLIPALQMVFSENENVEAIFVGYKGTSLDGMSQFIRTTKWFDNADEYRTYLSEERIQIGLAVVDDSAFGKCKFYNKFLEYSKLGVIGIYSNCEPYTMIVVDGVNGLLTNNKVEDWATAIKKAIYDKGLREKCVRNAQSLMREEFRNDIIINKIVEALPELEKFKSDYSKITYNTQLVFLKYRLKQLTNCICHPLSVVNRIKEILK